jgi:hypothetical protein
MSRVNLTTVRGMLIVDGAQVAAKLNLFGLKVDDLGLQEVSPREVQGIRKEDQQQLMLKEPLVPSESRPNLSQTALKAVSNVIRGMIPRLVQGKP